MDSEMDDPDFAISPVKKRKRRAVKVKTEPPETEESLPAKKKKVAAPRKPRVRKATATRTTKKKGKEIAIESNAITETVVKVEIKEEVEEISNKRPNAADYFEDDEFDDGQAIDGHNVSVLEVSRRWHNEELVAEQAGVVVGIARNVMDLLDNDCTIPFIARYRREMTGGLDAEKLRDIQASYGNVKDVLKRAENVAKSLMREGKLESDLQCALSNAKTLAEIEHLYAPHKSGSKRSLAEKARSLGLGDGAHALLGGRATVAFLQPSSLVRPDVKGLASENDVLLGWQHVAADVMAHDTDVLDFVRSLCHEDRDVAVKAKERAGSTTEESDKFRLYFDFRRSVALIKPHQVLALNRGESQKALTVKVEIPESIRKMTVDFCLRKWTAAEGDQETSVFLSRTAEDAYSRLLEKLMCRQIRSQLTRTAEKESVKVFCENLKHLLLTPPVRGRVVLGIDPGFTHGCKVAVVSPKGEVLTTDVLLIHSKKGNKHFTAERLRDILHQFTCETIALGNGTACRETETFLSDLIKTGFFHPLSPQYCIVNESGVSIYSVTKEAEEELPGMDPNLRSAVSLARRLQDPLLEYVKVEAKHIGIGMYQHDITQSTLKSALDEVAVECVSFVGVDLNVASEVILRRVAGLNASRARQIVAWRQTNGVFCNRRQLLLVKGLGPKSFEQCAGFVKIFPETGTCNSSKKCEEVVVPVTKGRKKSKVQIDDGPNPLDATTVHPESYKLAQSFLKQAGAAMGEVGKASTIQKVGAFVASHSLEKLALELGTSEPTLQQIAEALRQPLEYDLRSEFERPLFRQGVISISELEVGQQLTGRVTNCTNFGAFVDIGVGCDGLLHSSHMGGRAVSLGDRVTVYVDNVDVERRRIGLRLNKDGRQDQLPHRRTPSERNVVRDCKREVVSLENLKVGQLLTGRVKNCTAFGTFFDVGTECDGLLHISQMGGRQFTRDEQVSVCVRNVDLQRRRLGLHLGERNDSNFERGKSRQHLGDEKTHRSKGVTLKLESLAQGVPSVGDIVSGKVSSIKDYGAFVNLDCGVSGLAHRSRMNGIRVDLGSHVTCRVTRIVNDKGPQLELIDSH